jgi:coenzyme F420-dependent glucose-6-phosphate dehydrogenase
LARRGLGYPSERHLIFERLFMTKFGLTLSSEEHPPDKLVEIAVAGEEAGFDFLSISDHFHPWISEQGHSPFVWSVLGAIASSTESIEVGVGVTCPTVRIHPIINAHAAATTAVLFGGRFTWGVGSGEALNEHVAGHRWPPADLRLEMLSEAIDLIRAAWTGDSVTLRGKHYTVEDARIFDLPDFEIPLLVSAFGDQAAELAAEKGDGLWTTGLPEKVIETYKSAGGTGPIWSQLSLCWDADRDKAVERAHRVWPNTGLTGQLAQDLPTVAHFEQAVKMVEPSDIEESMPCGPDPGPILKSIQQAEELGIDYIYLHQVGDPLDGFLEFWKSEIQPEVT